jgi:hypothetical protein
VVVVEHQAVGVNRDPEPLDHLFQRLQEPLPVRILSNDRLAFVAACGHVVNRVREFHSNWSCHDVVEARIEEPTCLVSRLDPTPMRRPNASVSAPRSSWRAVRSVAAPSREWSVTQPESTQTQPDPIPPPDHTLFPSPAADASGRGLVTTVLQRRRIVCEAIGPQLRSESTIGSCVPFFQTGSNGHERFLDRSPP